jgi:type III secretory pathway component EscV
MTILPSVREKLRIPRHGRPARHDAERCLVRAFATFTQAADALEKSYGQLQTEVARLGGELDRANSELTRSLEENTRVRAFLAQILEGLPCGVPVLDGLQKLVGDPAAIASTILLCNSPARFHLRRLLEPFLPRVVVLSLTEIPPGISVQSLGVVR